MQYNSPFFSPILKRAVRDAVAETTKKFMDLGIRRNAVDYINDEFMLQIIQKATEEVRRGCRLNAVDATHNQELLETIKEAVKESMQQIFYAEI